MFGHQQQDESSCRCTVIVRCSS